ncbi:protein LAZ1 2 isoform X1 [Cinnamomum micranthum f. kanehirae]|uniref:Protein LAZ1 2 isoform X1 n=1 Tax=Cinnamomum micranthum f. kanehirae TaxID=337451 RepID=A0A443NLW3_9MAGN|nr:protein LAZ1 2 isoform X1 [Cinnamomum micranthum f. kanehirae]
MINSSSLILKGRSTGFTLEDLHGMALSDLQYYQGGVYKNLHTPAVITGGVFVLVSLVLSLLLILQHLRSYTKPNEQKWVVGVLFMVPVYAAESLISLWKARFSMVCDILRNCYEAFALYCFGSYLVACLGGEERVRELLENESRKQLTEPLLHGEGNKGALQETSFTNFFCQPSVLGKDLYTIVMFGLVQYMILKTFCSFLALLLEYFGVYGEGQFNWHYGYPYIAGVINFSQMWALYCLVQFYNVTHHWLQSIRPLAKFISFKAIVFATWWQGVGIAILCSLGVLPKQGKFQNGLQDFLICIEMAIAAVAHVYVFPAEPYRFQPVSERGRVTTEETKDILKLEGDDNTPSVVEQKETHIQSPGTSVTESVQDIFISGGEHVVKDVVLTITQAMEPVEKGVTKIQEKFHHMSSRSDHVEQGTTIEVDEVVEQNMTGSGTDIASSKTEIDVLRLP